MARNRKKKQKQVRKTTKVKRNPYALIASWRSGAGRHPNKRNAQRKKACRGKVQQDQR